LLVLFFLSLLLFVDVESLIRDSASFVVGFQILYIHTGLNKRIGQIPPPKQFMICSQLVNNSLCDGNVCQIDFNGWQRECHEVPGPVRGEDVPVIHDQVVAADDPGSNQSLVGQNNVQEVPRPRCVLHHHQDQDP